MKEHFWQNFDKILLALLFMIAGGASFVLILHKADDAALQWCESLAGNLGSAIIAIAGANRLAAKAQNGTAPSASPENPARIPIK